ncbi:hypothetical protein QFC24_005016 [Naganishia onofrii]|uniref:Uncharacterized protein n=1 Tax=Naganishia onofrii TaxID=1851511 RepID=A0ACC2XCF1_9TREE|nr:hypothetical protein QFC24_005016 [Naganishia onofrii]
MVSEAAKDVYHDASFEMHDGRRLPVIVAVKADLIVIQTLAKQDLLPVGGISSELIAVYSISEIGDDILSRLHGQGSKRLIQYLKEARRAGIKGTRRRYELRENKGQSTIAVAVLASALFNLVATNSTKTQRAAVDLLRVGESCFKFGLGDDTPKYEDVQTFSSSVATASKTGSRLIKLVPHLSLGMSLEFLKALGHIDGEHRISLISLSTPWFQQCVEIIQPFSDSYVANMASMRELVRGMIDLTVSQEEHWSAWLEPLWRALSNAPDDIMDMILGEILEVVQGSEMEQTAWKGLQAALRSFSANGLIVKLASRLRKKIAATYTNTCPVLTDSAAWPEISCLLQAAFLRISASIPQSDLFVALPDITYALVMTAGLGSEKIRTCAHSLTLRVIELCIDENPDATSDLLLEAQSEAILHCYGLVPSKNPDTSYTTIAKIEKLCAFLLRILTQSAPTLDLQNVWLARLLGLFSASCFQYNPAVQQRALVALGALINGARPGEVEDDFMYQLLVAIHNALAQPINGVSDMLLTSMLRCLTLVISGVSPDSRYGGAATFWLGLGVLQTGRIPLMSVAIDLLVAALKQAEGLGLAESGIQRLLLTHRPKDLAVIKLDAYTGVDFQSKIAFTFSVAALAYRGMRIESTRAATKELFGLLMAPGLTHANARMGFVPPQCLAYFLCRYSVKNNNVERKYLVDLTCGKGTFDRLPNHANVFSLLEIPYVSSSRFTSHDNILSQRGRSRDTPTAIMVIALLFGMLRAAELEHERVVLLTTLAEAARQLPDIVPIWQTYAHNELVNYLIQSSNPQIFVAVNSILNIVGNLSSRDDFLDTASRISHDTRTSIDSNMDSNATLKDLKMSCLQYMGNFRFDADK